MKASGKATIKKEDMKDIEFEKHKDYLFNESKRNN